MGTALEWEMLDHLKFYCTFKMQFAYNADGTLATMTYRQHGRHTQGLTTTQYVEREDVYTYRYDAQGTLSNVEIAVGDTLKYDGSVDKAGSAVEMKPVYGSFYFYNQ